MVFVHRQIYIWVALINIQRSLEKKEAKMVSNELIAYIRKELKRGFGTKTIKKALSQVGYTKNDIKTAFSLVGGVGAPTKGSAFEVYSKPQKKHITTIVLGVIILFIVMGGVFFGVPYLKNNQNLSPFPWFSNKIRSKLELKPNELSKTDLEYIENGINKCKESPQYKECITNFPRTRESCDDLIGGCQDAVYKNIFKNIKTAVLCNQMKIEDNVDVCFSELASNTNNILFCNKINKKSMKDYCQKKLQ